MRSEQEIRDELEMYRDKAGGFAKNEAVGRRPYGTAKRFDDAARILEWVLEEREWSEEQ